MALEPALARQQDGLVKRLTNASFPVQTRHFASFIFQSLNSFLSALLVRNTTFSFFLLRLCYNPALTEPSSSLPEARYLVVSSSCLLPMAHSSLQLVDHSISLIFPMPSISNVSLSNKLSYNRSCYDKLASPFSLNFSGITSHMPSYLSFYWLVIVH